MARPVSGLECRVLVIPRPKDWLPDPALAMPYPGMRRLRPAQLSVDLRRRLLLCLHIVFRLFCRLDSCRLGRRVAPVARAAAAAQPAVMVVVVCSGGLGSGLGGRHLRAAGAAGLEILQLALGVGGGVWFRDNVACAAAAGQGRCRGRLRGACDLALAGRERCCILLRKRLRLAT